jgi:hypothetical protein
MAGTLPEQTRKLTMRTKQIEFIDAIIDPIPVFGPILADLFYTWTGLSEAMNLRQFAEPMSPLPPGDNVVQLATKAAVMDVRKAA